MKKSELSQEQREKELFKAIDEKDFALFEAYIEEFPDCFSWKYGAGNFSDSSPSKCNAKESSELLFQKHGIKEALDPSSIEVGAKASPSSSFQENIIPHFNSFHEAAIAQYQVWSYEEDQRSKRKPVSDERIKKFFFEATKNGRFEIVKFFLEKYENSYSWDKSEDNEPFFCRFFFQMNKKIFELFLHKAFKNKNIFDIDYFLQNVHCTDGKVSRYYQDNIQEILESQGDVQFIKLLFLHSILKKHNSEFNLLLNLYPDLISFRYGENNVTPLHVAVSISNFEAVEELIKRGANIKDNYGKDYEIRPDPRFNALFISVSSIGNKRLRYNSEENNQRTLEVLLKHNISEKMSEVFVAYSFLHLAARNAQDCMKIFLNYGFDINTKYDGQTILHHIITSKYVAKKEKELMMKESLAFSSRKEKIVCFLLCNGASITQEEKTIFDQEILSTKKITEEESLKDEWKWTRTMSKHSSQTSNIGI